MNTRTELVRRYRRALARAKRYNGAVHWATVQRLADKLVTVQFIGQQCSDLRTSS